MLDSSIVRSGDREKVNDFNEREVEKTERTPGAERRCKWDFPTKLHLALIEGGGDLVGE